MNPQQIKDSIIAYSKIMAIDAIGFTSREALLASKNHDAQYQALGYSCGFEEQDHEKRLDMAQSLDGAKTVITIAIAYPNMPIEDKLTQMSYHGYFCRASWGTDYHQVVGEKLQQLALHCQQLIPQLQYKILVDTGSLSDRGAAVSCGLGWIGRHSNLITAQFGSFVYLGELIIDYPLPSDQPMAHEGCGQCTRCVEACPLGAIDGQQRMINTKHCLAFRTLDKNYPEETVIEAIGEQGYLYGCDICQLVCPYNHKPAHIWHEALQGRSHEIAIDLLSLLKMTNKQFRQHFGHLSGSWRGKRVLQRNALFILGYRRLPELAAFYQVLIDDDQSAVDIVQAARWALEKLD